MVGVWSAGRSAGWHWPSYVKPVLNVPDQSGPAGLPLNETTASSAVPVKVWLVDDNDSVRTLVAEALGHYQGIQCARHFSSPDALLSELASKPGPDVILLDVQMGDRNGLDAVRPIKSLTRSTRVLMFTTCFNPEWRDRALSDGASDYLLKSCNLDRMAERIRCPATNQSPGTQPRRRAKRLAEKPEAGSPAKTASPPASPLLQRTLNLLRKSWSAGRREPVAGG